MSEPKRKIGIFFHPEYVYSPEEQSDVAEIFGEYFDVEYRSGTLLNPEIFITIGLGVLAGTAAIAFQSLIAKITEDLYEAAKRALKKQKPKPQTWKFNFVVDGVSFSGEIESQSQEKTLKAFENLLYLFQSAEQVTIDKKLPDRMIMEEIKKDLSKPNRVLTSEDNLNNLRRVTFKYNATKGRWEIVSIGYEDGYFVKPAEAKRYRKFWDLPEDNRGKTKKHR